MIEHRRIQARLDALTKPPGSLGKLEDLAATLARIQGTLAVSAAPRRLVIFAADHGVVAEGVSAWPSEVTRLMLDNIARGGAASSVLAGTTGTELHLVDVGTIGGKIATTATTRTRKVAEGSRNLAREPALTPQQFEQAWSMGAAEADLAVEAGCVVLAAGEMGIGNTTSAACLTALMTGLPAADVVGRGAGADDATLARKIAVVDRAVQRAGGLFASDRIAAIASIAGWEIAAMAGFYARAAERRCTIVLDGFIATSSALIAESLQPETCRRMIAAHRSAEPGHTAALRQLGLVPYLDGWNMRLGEGTGALLLMPLLDCAAAMLTKMATLEDLGLGPS